MFDRVRDAIHHWFNPDSLPPAITNVSCHSNPYDLRPAVDAIMAAENWILDRIPPDQKLVILMGERHDFLTASLLLAAVLKRHAEQLTTHISRDFALGIEAPHNEGSKLLSGQFDSFIKSHSKELIKLCSKNKIPVSCNDIANIWLEGLPPVIDNTEPKTKNLIERHRPDLVDRVIFRAPWDLLAIDFADGVTLSNLAILENALEHLQRTQARIYIQHCGGRHVLGSRHKSNRFENSLTNIFMDRGFAVLPVFAHFECSKNFIPWGTGMLGQTIKISGLAAGDVPSEEYYSLRERVVATSHMKL